MCCTFPQYNEYACVSLEEEERVHVLLKANTSGNRVSLSFPKVVHFLVLIHLEMGSLVAEAAWEYTVCPRMTFLCL